MDTEEQRDRLYQIAASDPNPARRAEARVRLSRLPTKTADTGKPPVNMAHGSTDPDPVSLQDAPEHPLNRYGVVTGVGPNPHPAVEGTKRVVNGATAGLLDSITDLGERALGIPGASRRSREEFSTENPTISTALGMAGGFAPGGVPARIGGAINTGVRSAITSLSPKLQTLIGPTLQRLAGGAASGAVVGGTQAGLEADGSQLDKLSAMGKGAAMGGAVGGGLALGGAAAGKAASLLRDDDIALLEKYGLRPSMIPGVPVAREGASVREAMSNPPLGTQTAGPETRQAAGIKAAQTILPDLVARAKANSEQIGQERAGNLFSGVADRPISHAAAAAEADALMSDPGALPTVRSSLGTVSNRLGERAAPHVAGQPAPGATIPAADLQQIASMSHKLAEPDAYGASEKPELRLLGGRLHSLLPDEMLDQDARYSTSTKNMERARESLSMEHGEMKNPEGEPPMSAIRRVGNLIGRTGEGTKAAATADLGVGRLRDEGPPEVMKGPGGSVSNFAPGQIDYATAIDQPALHVAQENLQLNPSAVFSGAGVKGLAHRLGGAGARRLLYVPLRDAGRSENAGRGAAPLITLIDALRLRLRQDEDSNPTEMETP